MILNREAHYNWKGGKHHDVRGYMMVSDGHHGRIAEHRLIMEEYLGRKLIPNEIVHHINGIKDDNRIENLELHDRSKHCSHHLKEHWKQGLFNESNQYRERDPRTGKFICQNSSAVISGDSYSLKSDSSAGITSR